MWVYFGEGLSKEGLSFRVVKISDEDDEGSIISQEQSAFISGRQILDGPLILSEVLGVKWRGWIKASLASARTSILLNGSPTSEFSLKGGLRQGDPLSPFLFIIVMEGIHITLRDGLAANMFHGVKFSCLILSVFYIAFILKININQSNLYGVGASSIEVDQMAAGTGCAARSFPISYLGLPIGGRLTLIKSVLGSLGIYYLSIFKESEAVIKALKSLRALFFWGASKDKRS
nr:RNA-directed DNA polymerase, eukaryota, reverse transcriptase zinc-binding domain protein [Tanacetum cinerariifolium]